MEHIQNIQDGVQTVSENSVTFASGTTKDIKQFKFGRIFKYVGMNAITIYFLSSFISKSMYLIKIGAHSNLHNYLYETIFVHSFFSDNFSSLLYALTVVLMYAGLGYLMFRKKIFIKV